MKHANKLLLVVDDFEGARQLYSELLLKEGFRVVFAGDGQEGLHKANELQPDAILMDLSLPRMNGWEATRHLKANEKTRQIPVIMLSAYDLDGTRSLLEEAGFDGMLTKPWSPEEMVAEITRVLERRHPSELTPPAGSGQQDPG